MMAPPASATISVIIPAYNAALYLPQALASVMGQAGHRLEVIVVDDASSDETAAIAASFETKGVRCLRRPIQGGAGAARNSGVAAAQGEYLAFLDADDLWPTGRLSFLLATLDGATAPRIAFGHMRQFLCPEMSPEIRRRLQCPTDPMPGYCAGAMLLRREDFHRVGPFEEDLKVGEFIGWFARARDLGFAPIMIEDVVLERRIHGANQTINHRGNYTDYVHALKRALDRRRPGAAS